MKKVTALFALLSLLIACQSPINPNAALPTDPDLTSGKLANGLQYFILPNKEPNGRVYLRLVVNAGSMHEEDDQKGVAHLVEHMAFNGSRKFPQNQIIYALEKLGMKFARDINAFTDFENTVYTLNLDNNSPQKLALAFEVVNEWMNHLTIEPKDLDGERRVVEEEWRRRLSPMLRLADKKSAIEMAGSRYVLRDPIGDMAIIRHISRERVADFYRTWYRPDNMSIIVVGDIEPKHIVNLLTQYLSQENPLSQTPLRQVDFSIPLIERWRVASVAEQGTTIPSIELSFFENASNDNSIAAYKQDLIQQMVTRLVNLRLQKWEKTQQKHIDSANFYRTHLGKETLQTLFSLQLFETDYRHVVNALFQFIAEIRQYGFGQEEFDHEIHRLTQLNEKQRHIRQGSLKIADDLIIAAANKQVVLNRKDRYALNNRFLAEITLADLNKAFNQTLALNAKLLLVTQPLPEKHLPFNAADLERQWHEAMPTQQNRQAEKHPAKLPHLTLQEGELRQETHWKQGDIYEFRLSNGSKLIYHYSDKTPNQVHFRAITQGGLRSIPNSDYHRLRTAVNLVDDSGIGPLPLAEINQLFAENPIVLATIADDDKQGFSGVAKTADLANLLTLFRLKLQTVAITESVLERYRREISEAAKQADVETQFMQTVSRLRFPNIATVYSQNPTEQLAFTAQELSQAYQRYILDKTDFTYFIIGDVPLNDVQKLAKTYLASVEVKHQNRRYQAPHIHTPEQRFTLRGLSEPRADVEIYLSGQNPWQAEQVDLLEILGEAVQEKLRLILREQASGIYSVTSWFSQEPFSPQIEGKIAFSCAPNRVEELLGLTQQILDEILQHGVDETLLKKKIAEQQTQIKHRFDSLVSITSMLEDSYWQQGNPQGVYRYQQLERLATKQAVDALAQKALAQSGRFITVLRP